MINGHFLRFLGSVTHLRVHLGPWKRGGIKEVTNKKKKKMKLCDKTIIILLYTKHTGFRDFHKTVSITYVMGKVLL